MTNDNPQQPSEAFLRSIDIHTLLPQQEPFVMVGRLTHFDNQLTVTETTIRAENIFVDDGRFSASGLMENIAQTCAARIGYVNKYILKRGIQIGVIGAIRGFDVRRLPSVGDVVTTSVSVEQEVFGMILASATVMIHDEEIAVCQMKIAIKEENV